MTNTKRIQAAKRLLSLARELTAADDGEEVDEAFAGRIRNLRTKLNKLSQKKRRKLNQFGIGVIRPNSTVEDLVGALEQVLAEA